MVSIFQIAVIVHETSIEEIEPIDLQKNILRNWSILYKEKTFGNFGLPGLFWKKQTAIIDNLVTIYRKKDANLQFQGN